MPRFRARTAFQSSDPKDVRQVIAEAMQPAHFFVGKKLRLEWEHVEREGIPWEIFQGRLLASTQTRLRQSFEAWNVYRLGRNGRSAEPLLAVKFDAAGGLVHVVRAIWCHVREGYHAGDNVYRTRKTKKWVRELVGTLRLAQFRDWEEFRDELICRLFQAVVGTSRLALTSLEAPLPDFILGRLGYFYRSTLPEGPARDKPMESVADLRLEAWQFDLAWREQVKMLELVLRVPASTGEPADYCRHGFLDKLLATERGLPLWRGLFNEVSLSPYRGPFIRRALAVPGLGKEYDERAERVRLDSLCDLLCRLGRHLTAYDLIQFHHRGANYPDLLLVDTILETYLGNGIYSSLRPCGRSAAVETHRRRWRRGMRQGWIVRRQYEGLPVPRVPTSPGENARVWPAPHRRVPERQIVDPSQRPRVLFDGDPLMGYLNDTRIHANLVACLRDLEHPCELQELGMATFLDRPLGVFKAPGEPDQTLLLSYDAFSRSIAQKRLAIMEQWAILSESSFWPALEQRLTELKVPGIPLDLPADPLRHGGVSLTDALRVADDFVIVRTTAQTTRAFLRLFDFTPLAKQFALDDLSEGRRVVIMRTAHLGGLRIFDDQDRCRLELQIDRQGGYECRGGIEYPVRGLQVVRLWEPIEGVLREQHPENVFVRPL